MREAIGWSLRRRLILIGAAAMTAALVLGGAAMVWAETIAEREMVDARLEQLGGTILSLVDNDLIEKPDDPVPGAHRFKTRPSGALLYRFQVWTRDGVLHLRSHEAPADRPIADLQHRGFETVRMGGEDYRVFSLPTHDQGVVQVAENLEETSLKAGTIAGYYAGLLALPFALVFVLSWVLTRRSLKSVDALASELRQRNPLDVTDLVIANPPQELQPILSALNSLFTRAAQAYSVERRFTSVAAHELRTPLAGLRAQAQLASTARNETESRHALGAIMQGVDRATLMLDQLLDLARIEDVSQNVEAISQSVKLGDVYRDVMHDLRSKAIFKDITVDVRFDADELYAFRFGLQLMLRNLLSNAIMYCPEGGRVDVRSARLGDDVVLTVDDSGVGIAPADRDRAFERFNRLGQNQIDGVGLGLSIVLRIVEFHRARIQLLEAPIGGLRVQITFPQTSPPSAAAPSRFHAPA
ncbi:MAG: ATP-binding protein [Burkholderiales bacterium]